MPTVCTCCAKDPALIRILLNKGQQVERCTLCSTAHAQAIDTKSIEFKGVFRALIRLHFSEWQYNTHHGGVELLTLFDTDNPILRHDLRPDDLEDAILPALEEGYESAGCPISIYAGYDSDGRQNKLLMPMPQSDEHRLVSLRRRVASTNHFLLEDVVRSLLEPHRASLQHEVARGTELHRARIGVQDSQEDVLSFCTEYFPYGATQLGAPPQLVANSGRLNRTGVSFLYLASERSTAINEVRPHPGHRVSTGSFRSMTDLKVADFSGLKIEDFSGSDALLDEYWLLRSIDNAFSLPVPPEERARYMLTQLLTDGTRHLGFDGVAYRSSVGQGTNYAFFDPSSWEYIEGSGQAVRVDRVDYHHTALRVAACEISGSSGVINDAG